MQWTRRICTDVVYSSGSLGWIQLLVRCYRPKVFVSTLGDGYVRQSLDERPAGDSSIPLFLDGRWNQCAALGISYDPGLATLYSTAAQMSRGSKAEDIYQLYPLSCPLLQLSRINLMSNEVSSLKSQNP